MESRPAAADRLRNELLGAALDEWEAEDGTFTEAELSEAASRLRLAPRPGAGEGDPRRGGPGCR